VRLALLGPADSNVAMLARAAATALQRLAADKVIYLGGDDALDRLVMGWARMIGAEPSLVDRLADDDGGILAGDADAIMAEIERERARRRLVSLRTLGGPGTRALEILNERIVVLVDDKSVLDEEDLLPATIIAFGKGDPVIRRVGTRVFVAPGHPAKGVEGLAVLDEGEGAVGITVSLHDVDGEVIARDYVETSRSAKLKVHGAV
jgi:hypothetical protein